MKPKTKPVIVHHMEFPVIESTVEFITPNGYSIRIWRNEDNLKDEYDNEDVMAVALSKDDLHMDALARTIAKLPRVNAVQIRKRNAGTLVRGFKVAAVEHGVVVYSNWP